MSLGRVVVPLRPGSDGDASHRPRDPAIKEVDPPTLYLEKLAAQWMKSRGLASAGVTYVLDRLPAGYALFQKPRQSNPNHVDKWLYGHPSHKYFDSPNRFWPHFKHLMDNGGNSMGCPCTVCNASGRVIPPIGAASTFAKRAASKSGTSTPKTSGIPQAKGRPKLVQPGMDTSRVDEEGTPDVYRNLINKLKKHGTIDEVITEPMSLDWRTEQECLPKLMEDLKNGPLYLPRKGEIVLFLRQLPKGVTISYDNASSEFRLYDTSAESFLGPPTWEAGLVGQTPLETTTLDDLIYEPAKDSNLSLSGFRVEPLPNPNSLDKSLSKRYQYVPLHQIRPFILWNEFLSHVPNEEWHPTIRNALTLMSTFSLLDKHRFKGLWPEAWIYCYGIYIGSELLTIGDTVRLLPKPGTSTCEDILVIKTIRIKLSHLDLASDNDYDEGRPYNTSAHLFGNGFTTDPSRSSGEWQSMNDHLPKVTAGYGPFYPLHGPRKEMTVPFNRVVGRLFEAEAVELWLPDSQTPNLDYGQEDAVDARAYAKANDSRIDDHLGMSWYWGDSRAQALDLQTVNGIEVGRFDEDRDPKAWRSKIKVIDGMEKDQQSSDHRAASSGPQRNLRAFMMDPSQQHQSLPFRAGSASLSEPDICNNTGIGSGSGGGGNSKKRVKAIDLSDGEEDDDDDEIAAQTKLIDNPFANKKKAKVSVVIGK